MKSPTANPTTQSPTKPGSDAPVLRSAQREGGFHRVSFPTLWHFWNSGPREPAWNMAADETLLHSCDTLAHPLLRSYDWSVPAATFGYFQKYQAVSQLTSVRPLIRRPTGGGIVLHESDWTYSVVIPAAHAWYRCNAAESYHLIHEWIAAALQSLGVETTLAESSGARPPTLCFAQPARFDVLSHDAKIAGAAQRRAKTGLLIQGSIQPAAAFPAIPRISWLDAMRSHAASQWNASWSDWNPTPDFLAAAHSLAIEKYSAPDFNQRRIFRGSAQGRNQTEE